MSIDNNETHTIENNNDLVNNTSSRKRVRFDHIRMREYNRIVGDHPDTKVGPPMSLSWEYVERQPVNINDYESTRKPYKRTLRMSSVTRKNILLNVFEIPEEEIVSAEKEIQKIRKQRETTAKLANASSTIESVTKKPLRKLGKRLFRSLAVSSRYMVAAGPMYVGAY
jgi:hypothetical protein